MTLSRQKPSVLAVILARGGSKGIPLKNIVDVCGHPLISYSIAAALNSRLINKIVVSTDDERIAEVARDYGAETPFLRPAHLANDTATSAEALLHAVETSEAYFQEEFDYIIELPCVAPLRDHTHIDEALDLLIESSADSVIGMVSSGEKHPVRLKRIVDGQIQDFSKEFPEPNQSSRRQDLEPCFIRNGSIYSMTRRCLFETKGRHGADSRPYMMPEDKSVNIDGQIDLLLATSLIEKDLCANRPRKKPQQSIEKIGRGKIAKLLVTADLSFLQSVKDTLIENFDCIFARNATSEMVAELVSDVDAWFCSPCPEYRIDRAILEQALRLKVISTPSTGVTHIDVDYCRDRDIELRTLRKSEAVENIFASSEFTFSLILAAVRNLFPALKGVQRGEWREFEERYRGLELNGRTLGVIGYGRIGRNICRYARGFGMKLLAHDPYVLVPPDHGVTQTDLDDVLAQADVLAVCVHLDESTRLMVDESFFSKTKSGVVFVNTSRGEIVDEDALVAALGSGHVSAAAVDVLPNEQSDQGRRKSPLLQYSKLHDNLTISPHIAGLTFDSERKAAEQAASSVLQFFQLA